jgi:hypothetical protein
MEGCGRESDVSTAAVAFVKRAASHEVPNHPARSGTHDKRRHATAPGKLRLTSVAKGIASPALLRLARRAGCRETGSSSSTEAHQSNPTRSVRETSNPDVLSDAILCPARRAGAMRKFLVELAQSGRHRSKRVRHCALVSTTRNPVQGVLVRHSGSCNLAGVGSFHLATSETGPTGPGTVEKCDGRE